MSYNIHGGGTRGTDAVVVDGEIRTQGSRGGETVSVFEKFLDRIEIGRPGTCWEWRGVKDRDGYGYMTVMRSPRRYKFAHRLAMEFYGTIPVGFEVDHLCFNRSCVNPSHLEAVSRDENERRKLVRMGGDYPRDRYGRYLRKESTP